MRGQLFSQHRALVAVMCAALAGCFPDFEFGNASSSGQGQGGEPTSSRAVSGPTVGPGGQAAGGQGDGGELTGQGGIPGHMTSTVTTDASTSTGTVVPGLTVPCGDGTGAIVECATEPESCCLSLQAQSMDHCEASSDCGGQYYTLGCNGPADCPGQICCAWHDILFGEFEGPISCQSACSGVDKVVCTVASDCGPGETCAQLFPNSFAPEYAPHYRVCE